MDYSPAELTGQTRWPRLKNAPGPIVPGERDWEELDLRFRKHGMVEGGSLGPPADEVIRIGHMGAQADLVLIDRGMDVLARVPSRGRDTGAKKVI